MKTYHNHIFSSTRSKYLKFKSRLEKNISNGAFDSFSRKKKNNLISRVNKFRTRLENFGISVRGTAVAGSMVSAAALPNLASAQIDPNFYLANASSVQVTGANDVVAANIDADDDLEIIFATTTGAVIADFDGKDGYTTKAPSAMTSARDAIFVGDIDGDTDIDLIFADAGDGTYFYRALNDGNGNFTVDYIDALNSFSDIDLVDWDSDGDLDIVASSFGNGFEVLENDGAGGFTNLGSFTLNEDGVRDIEFADLDNDGDMDLLHVAYMNTVPYTGSVYALENTTDGPGTPTFDVSSPVIIHQNSYNRFKGIVTLDFDGDGDLDLFFHQQFTPYGHARRNNLIGGSPFSFSNVNLSYTGSSGSIQDAAVADFDNDGDDDLILAASSFNRLFIFDGVDYLNGDGGNLSTEIGDVSDYFNKVFVADLSGDDNIDLVGVTGASSAPIYVDNSAPTIGGFTGSIIIDENTPIGSTIGFFTFTDIQDDPISFNLVGPDAAFFSIDAGTGELTTNAELDWETKGSDLLFQIELSDGNKTRIDEGTLKINNLAELGQRTFSDQPLKLFGKREMTVFEPGDHDMDGDTDLFVSSYLSTRYNSLLEQTAGSFADEPIDALTTYQSSAKFIRANGDLNLLVHDETNDELRLHDNGEGGFSGYSTLQSGLTSVKNIITGDFDGDSQLEIAVHAETSTINEVVILFEDQGSGFVQTQYFLMHESSGGGLLDGLGSFSKIAIADFDGDGFDDMLAVTVNGDDVVFSGGFDLGGGDYGFESTYSTVITQADGGETEVQVGDIDGDGSDDIAIIRWEDNVNYALQLDIHLNDGNGVFTLDQTMDLGGEYAADFQLVDIDGNGSNDFVVSLLRTEDIGGELELTFDLETFVNDGTGSFNLFQSFEEVGGEDFKMMDVDGDDDLDIVMRYGFTGGEEVENQLKVYKNTNVSPTAINLSSTTLDEHLSLDTEIATLSVDDLNPGDTHVYSLATGDGTNDLHNSFFSLNGNSLRVVKDVRFENTPQLNIYLSVYDGHQVYHQAIVLDVNDVNLAPTGINLSSTSFDEGTVPGTEIATITAIDPNVGDMHYFEFATGDGTNDADNDLFLIDGDRLIITDESSFEAKPSYNIYLSVFDIDNSFEQAFVINVNDINQAPTGISLSATSFDEGTATGSSIATLSAIDANVGDNHVFELTTGDGTNDADNASFIIDGDQLVIVNQSNFETKPSYTIHLTVSDDEGSFSQAFVINVNDINQAPTGISLSATSFDEGTATGSSIATLSAIDANVGDNHVFELTTGDGINDADNSSFLIDGDQLVIVNESNFETKPSYNIHLTVSDAEGTFSQAFVVSVNDINQAPTGITLSAISFDEGTTPGSSIATLSAIDANVGDSHVFELTTGDGTNDADNSSFLIDGDQLVIVNESNFETKPSYNIHITVSDDEGSFNEAFLIGVNDINQAPTAITLSNSMLDEGTVPGTTIASVSVTDPNAGDSHAIALAPGDGTNDANNDLFIINGNNLILIGEVDFDQHQTLNINISANDGSESLEESFELTVNDVLGLQDEINNVLGIYPNPGHDFIQINLDNSFIGELTVRITDLSGKIIHAFEGEKENNLWTDQFDMTGAEAGIYLVEITLPERKFVQRWIKK
ncbi:MAG: FG-GAP-like repeat-containing protein [Cyclobacteriaceae bacterium]